ncbi:MAG: hypothetical protein ACLQVN_24625 [Bryobacteraceae bacterium]
MRIYANKATLFAVPFDTDKLETPGTAEPILDEVAYDEYIGASQWDVSAAPSGHGTLLYRRSSGGPPEMATLQWVDSTGRNEPLAAKPGAYLSVNLSPDGKRAVLMVGEAATADLWVSDLQRDAMTRLTFGGVKGGEADVVFPFPDVSPAGGAAYQKHGPQRDSVEQLLSSTFVFLSVTPFSRLNSGNAWPGAKRACAIIDFMDSSSAQAYETSARVAACDADMDLAHPNRDKMVEVMIAVLAAPAPVSKLACRGCRRLATDGGCRQAPAGNFGGTRGVRFCRHAALFWIDARQVVYFGIRG